MSRFRPVRLLGGLLALGLTLTLSAAAAVPTSAAGSGKPSAPAAARGGAGTRTLPAGATACRSTKAKPSSSFAACATAPAARTAPAATAAATIAATITLSASSLSVAPGGTTTLTATASLDVGPTPYFIEIFDVAAGTLVAECGFGTSCSSSVTQGSAVRFYQAFISSFGTTFPPPNIQASSFDVDVAWVSVSLASSPASLPAGGTAAVTATASLDVGPTPLWIEVFDLTGNAQVAICGAGVTCSASVAQSAATEHAYVAFLAGLGGTLPPPNVRAGSNTVFVDWVSNTPLTPPAIVPNLVGDTVDQASSALQTAGLVLGSQGTDVDCNNLQHVSRQTPGAGTQVAAGSSVSISIGVPPAPPAVCP